MIFQIVKIISKGKVHQYFCQVSDPLLEFKNAMNIYFHHLNPEGHSYKLIIDDRIVSIRQKVCKIYRRKKVTVTIQIKNKS
jgi:hypothetical protein